MRKFIQNKLWLSLILSFFVIINSVLARENHSNGFNLELRDTLLKMVKEDQNLRKQVLENKDKEEELWSCIKELDYTNALSMHEILERYGWPGFNFVGKEGSHAAWLIIQHTDHNIALQEKGLDLLKEAVKNNNASPIDLAYLTDRILVNQGKLQCYGTQLQQSNGKLVPKPIENEEQVDQRRKTIGMKPLQEYIIVSEKIILKTTS